MTSLMTKSNEDVNNSTLDKKSETPEIGENLIALLQECQYWWQMNAVGMLWFSAYLPREIWDGKAHTFQFLFKSQQQTTPMP